MYLDIHSDVDPDFWIQPFQKKIESLKKVFLISRIRKKKHLNFKVSLNYL